MFETNVLGIIRVTHAMRPILRGSKNPVIVKDSTLQEHLESLVDPRNAG